LAASVDPVAEFFCFVNFKSPLTNSIGVVLEKLFCLWVWSLAKTVSNSPEDQIPSFNIGLIVSVESSSGGVRETAAIAKVAPTVLKMPALFGSRSGGGGGGRLGSGGDDSRLGSGSGGGGGVLESTVDAIGAAALQEKLANTARLGSGGDVQVLAASAGAAPTVLKIPALLGSSGSGLGSGLGSSGRRSGGSGLGLGSRLGSGLEVGSGKMAVVRHTWVRGVCNFINRKDFNIIFNKKNKSILMYIKSKIAKK
jgi:hypothetical protein